MVRKLTIDVSDEVYAGMQRAAALEDKTPEELLAQHAARLYATVPEKVPGLSLLKYAGRISVDDPRGVDNELIDEDLAREYGRGLDGR